MPLNKKMWSQVCEEMGNKKAEENQFFLFVTLEYPKANRILSILMILQSS